MTKPTKRRLQRRIDDLIGDPVPGEGDIIPTPDLTKAQKDALDAAFSPSRETPPGAEEWLGETYGMTPVGEGDLP